jgi:cytochrome c
MHFIFTVFKILLGGTMRLQQSTMTLGVLSMFGLTNAGAIESATPQEIISKTKEAAQVLSKQKEAGLGEFNKPFGGKWAWKDTYIFVYDCTADKMIGHPKAALVGKPVMDLKDKKGNLFFAKLCDAAKKTKGGWVEYWWPKPGSDEGYRKITYTIKVPNTNFQVGAGIYDKNVSISNLEKINN